MSQGNNYLAAIVDPKHMCPGIYEEGENLLGKRYRESGYTRPTRLTGNKDFQDTVSPDHKERPPVLGLYIINLFRMVEAQLLIWRIYGINSFPANIGQVFGEEIQRILNINNNNKVYYFGGLVSRIHNDVDTGLSKYLIAFVGHKILINNCQSGFIIASATMARFYLDMGFKIIKKAEVMPGYLIPVYLMYINREALDGLDRHEKLIAKMMQRWNRLKRIENRHLSGSSLHDMEVYEIPRI